MNSEYLRTIKLGPFEHFLSPQSVSFFEQVQKILEEELTPSQSQGGIKKVKKRTYLLIQQEDEEECSSPKRQDGAYPLWAQDAHKKISFIYGVLERLSLSPSLWVYVGRGSCLGLLWEFALSCDLRIWLGSESRSVGSPFLQEVYTKEWSLYHWKNYLSGAFVQKASPALKSFWSMPPFSFSVEQAQKLILIDWILDADTEGMNQLMKWFECNSHSFYTRVEKRLSLTTRTKILKTLSQTNPSPLVKIKKKELSKRPLKNWVQSHALSLSLATYGRIDPYFLRRTALKAANRDEGRGGNMQQISTADLGRGQRIPFRVAFRLKNETNTVPPYALEGFWRQNIPVSFIATSDKILASRLQRLKTEVQSYYAWKDLKNFWEEKLQWCECADLGPDWCTISWEKQDGFFQMETGGWTFGFYTFQKGKSKEKGFTELLFARSSLGEDLRVAQMNEQEEGNTVIPLPALNLLSRASPLLESLSPSVLRSSFFSQTGVPLLLWLLGSFLQEAVRYSKHYELSVEKLLKRLTEKGWLIPVEKEYWEKFFSVYSEIVPKPFLELSEKNPRLAEILSMQDKVKSKNWGEMFLSKNKKLNWDEDSSAHPPIKTGRPLDFFSSQPYPIPPSLHFALFTAKVTEVLQRLFSPEEQSEIQKLVRKILGFPDRLGTPEQVKINFGLRRADLYAHYQAWIS